MAHETVRDEAVGIAISVGIGVLFSSLFALGHREHAPRILLAGAITGLLIYIWLAALQRLFSARINRFAQPWRVIGHAALYMTGGVLGWLSGMVLSVNVLGIGVSIQGMPTRFGLVFLGLTALVTVIVGLSIYGYEQLQERLRTTIEQLKEAEWAEKEIALARTIQTRLLPPTLVESERFTIASRNLPAQLVAGDFYDIVRLEDGSIVLVVADVAGKGLGASLIMASVKAVLPFVAHEDARTAMSMINRKLMQELAPREFVALAFARLYPDRRVELLNAGCPEPYVVRKSGVEALVNRGERLPLGLRADAAYEPLSLQLAPGERLVLLSDGIPEAPVQGEPIGYERIAAILESMNGTPVGEAWLDMFLDRVRGVVDEGLSDDWTAVVVDVR